MSFSSNILSLAGAAAFALVASNANAQGFTGSVDLTLGYAAHSLSGIVSDVPEDTAVVGLDAFLDTGAGGAVDVGFHLGVRLDTDNAASAAISDPNSATQLGIIVGTPLANGAHVGAFAAAGVVHFNDGTNESETTTQLGLQYIKDTGNGQSYFGQVGGLTSSAVDSETLSSFVYVRGGGAMPIANGAELSGSILYGAGENDDNDPIDVLGLALRYSRPMNSGNGQWFVGYEGNLTRIDSGTASEESSFRNTIVAGATISFGSGARSGTRQPGISLDPVWAAGYTADIVD